MLKKYLLPLCLILVFLTVTMGTTGHVLAAPPNGVDHLRGRWDGTIYDLFGWDQPFTLLFDESAPDLDDPQAALYNGCMTVGDTGFAPISARVEVVGEEQFDVTLFGTAGGAILRMDGLFETRAPGVTDDTASGAWQTSEEVGQWTAIHHDRRNSKCPAVQLGEELFFDGGLNAIRDLNGDGPDTTATTYEGFSNVISSGMLVRRPDGSTLTVPLFTDIFSPQIDFINSFRYLDDEEGAPASGETYTFTLLDALGNPISGATNIDEWTDCFQSAPANHVATFVPMVGTELSWDAVPSAPGFEPGLGEGFYQIELGSLTVGGEGYGANGVLSAEHLVPWPDFGDFAPGSPDGFDQGKALSLLADGEYQIDVVAFSVAPPGSNGHGLECQVRDSSESLRFTKSGEDISFSQGSGEPISDTLIVEAGDPVQIATLMWSGFPDAQDIFDAVQMALDDYGLVHGFGLQQNQYDDGCNLQAGEDAANDVIDNAQNLGVVGAFCSVSAEGALPVLEDVSMVMVSYASTRPDLPGFGPAVFNRVTVMDPDFDDYWHAQVGSLQSIIDWETEYAIRYGHAPYEMARYAYDATLVLLAHLEAVSTVNLDGNLMIDRPSLAAAVRGTTGFPGVTGSISLDADGNRIP